LPKNSEVWILLEMVSGEWAKVKGEGIAVNGEGIAVKGER
jgi:hypothetical protein